MSSSVSSDYEISWKLKPQLQARLLDPVREPLLLLPQSPLMGSNHTLPYLVCCSLHQSPQSWRKRTKILCREVKWEDREAKEAAWTYFRPICLTILLICDYPHPRPSFYYCTYICIVSPVSGGYWRVWANADSMFLTWGISRIGQKLRHYVNNTGVKNTFDVKSCPPTICGQLISYIILSTGGLRKIQHQKKNSLKFA